MIQPRTPLIGITTNGRWERYYKLREEYVDAVRRAGGIPVMLPPGKFQLDDLLARLDGIIFSGGVDIDPQFYQGAHHDTLDRFEPDRDDMEIELSGKLLDLQHPVLFICRGMQVCNVAGGGSLIEHLPDKVGETVLHRISPCNPTPHGVTVQAGCRLAEILGQTEFTAASWHHQAAQKIAPGFRVVAQAPDGTIEAIEHPQKPWLVAVQWHPELTATDDPVQQRLFDWLVETAAKFKNKRK